MKRMILAAALIAAGIGLTVGIARYKNRPPASPQIEVESTQHTEVIDQPGPAPTKPAAVPRPVPPVEVAKEVTSTPDPVAPTATSAPVGSGQASQALVKQAVDTLLSSQGPYPQKQAAWQQLRDSGKLDQAIRDLEQRVADDPRTPEFTATLGQAYLQKCGTIQDVREQGILAMKADQAFDAALNEDPNNWEARFTKAMAMSYWPTQMNRGTEVMQHYVTLVEQQEAQSPQPHFAQTYTRLGDEYVKYGHRELAWQVWQRGLALFPENEELRAKLGGR